MIQDVVGRKVYGVWTSMLKRLAPDGRTHRLSVLIASMLQYTEEITYEKSGSSAKASKLSDIFEESHEKYVDGDIKELTALAETLLKDSGVKFYRTNSRGNGYSIAEEAVHQYLHWHDMPWES